MNEEQFIFLKEVLGSFSDMTDDDIAISSGAWRSKSFAKGQFYNVQNVVCKDLGVVVKGLFRVYHFEQESGIENNLYFFNEGQFVVSFRSFITQYPCAYYIEAMEDSEILYVPYTELQELYSNHKGWERFGRLLAEHFFNKSQERSEALLFYTHEQRYLKMMQDLPRLVERISSQHVASYLGIKIQSLSRIRKRIREGG